MDQLKNSFFQITTLVLIILICLGCSSSEKDTEPWISLFDGETLNGWTIKGGEAHYEVRDKIIVGSTVHDTPNTFLTTDKMYDDFILELDYKVDSSMNSGFKSEAIVSRITGMAEYMVTK